MIKDDKRVRLFIGHYGSGKSEVSLNYVTRLRELVEGEVALADLDVVNVYFRTREKKDLMRQLGITPIDSSIQTTTLDVPAVSAGVMRPLHDDKVNYVLDVGGDNVGGRVVGRFAEHFKPEDYDMFFVVNANREKTQTAKEVLGYIDAIEATSKLKVTGLVNNTHLLRETTVEDVLKGQDVVREVSKIKNIPIKYVCCLESLVDQLPKELEGDILPIKLYLREEWM
ncbi:ATP-binding protein [Terrisporobacter vanillatitrophus]|uniref:ATP-binding protein n=1 Tax=Terrisporobacter vanillatitrophus TaxID=3058402 RepID=UPI0033696C69